MNEYSERNIVQLDENGDHYSRHVNAMTCEKLHSKRDIAAELAYRDERIKKLENALKPFARFACSDKGECDCNNCQARDSLI